MYKKTGEFNKKSILEESVDQTPIKQPQETPKDEEKIQKFIIAIKNRNIGEAISILSSQTIDFILPYRVKSAIFESGYMGLMETLLSILPPEQEFSIDGKDTKELVNLLFYLTEEEKPEMLKKLLKNITIEPSKEQEDDISKYLVEDSGTYRLNPDAIKENRLSSETPLHLAAKIGQIEIVELLINSGANINQGDINGATPLHLAAREGHLDVVKALLANKRVDVNQKKIFEEYIRNFEESMKFAQYQGYTPTRSMH